MEQYKRQACQILFVVLLDRTLTDTNIITSTGVLEHPKPTLKHASASYGSREGLDTFAFFAFSFPKSRFKSDFRDSYRIFSFISDFRVSYRILASHKLIVFSRLKSDFHVSNQIFTSLFQIVFSRLKLDCHIAFPN